ncbi:MAG: amidohydrolase family protein [Candidatus Dormiibacterota bacterium]
MPRTILHDVSVVDVETGSTAGPRSVVISDDRIESISAADVARETGSVEGRGLFLTPGLIDAHVHCFFDAGSDPLTTFLSNDEEHNLAVGRRNLGIAAAAGITTVRDLGSPPQLMRTLMSEVESGAVVGPHIISSGAPLTRPGGHCHFFGGEVSTVDEVRSLIERQRLEGATSVKVMASGGGMTAGTRPSAAELPLELMEAARSAAEANGMIITAHCHATEAIRRSIAAGIPCIEHASFVEPSGHSEFDAEVANQLRATGTVVSPTVASGLRAAQLFRRQGRPYHPDDVGAIERLEARRSIAGELYTLGVTIIAGSDAGTDDTPFDVGVEEVTSLYSSGLTRQDALRAATSASAKCLGMRRCGEVKEGFTADLLLLGADPLVDLNALRSPLVVMKSGRIFLDRRRVEP